MSNNILQNRQFQTLNESHEIITQDLKRLEVIIENWRAIRDGTFVLYQRKYNELEKAMQDKLPIADLQMIEYEVRTAKSTFDAMDKEHQSVVTMMFSWKRALSEIENIQTQLLEKGAEGNA